MKVIDISTKNHISFNDLLEICKELDIQVENEETDLSDQDVFLVEKKIEVIKQKKIQKENELKKNKKIKLKRKITIVKKKDKEEEKSDQTKKIISKTVKKPYLKEPKKNLLSPQGKSTKKRILETTSSGKPSPKSGSEEKENKKEILSSLSKEKGEAVASKPDSSKKRRKGKVNKERENKIYKKDQNEKDFILKKRQELKEKAVVTPKEIRITEKISVGDLAKKMNVKANEVIAKLMQLGVMATINQIIDLETAEILAGEYGVNVKIISLYDETVIKQDEEDKKEDNITRPPIVTIMGHVDHGKTKLLDSIRNTEVVAGEAGGITQHIGAYKVHLNNKEITFFDTPGHESFTAMRARGAKITDIVILVVAANDGVMPQTIEAIHHAKAAEVPLIVAINKIDLAEANPQKIKQELANYELVPEEWGGSTLFAEVSAKEGKNISELLELVLIQSEMLELKANPKVRAKGAVVESKIDLGRGSVSTILIQKGTLKIGDSFVVGIHAGKVRAMFDDKGEPLKEAGPSTPVEILGINGSPSAGDPFEVVESEKVAKQISQKRLEFKRIESAKKIKKVTLESLNEMIKEGELKELNVVVKADVDGSAQALSEALEKLSNDQVRVRVIHSGAGGINESDVMLASASNAIILGFHVRPTGKVNDLALEEDVSIKFYNIIFQATDDIKLAMEGMLEPEFKEEFFAAGEVKKIFKISKVGIIAGSFLEKGKIARNHQVRLIRDGVVIFDGDLKSLKRFQDDVSAVEAGQEFGFSLKDFEDIKEGDNFETYLRVEIKKKIN